MNKYQTAWSMKEMKECYESDECWSSSLPKSDNFELQQESFCDKSVSRRTTEVCRITSQ